MTFNVYAESRTVERFLNLGIFRSKYDLDNCTDYGRDIPSEVLASERQIQMSNTKPIKTYVINYHNLKKDEVINIPIGPAREISKEEIKEISNMLDNGMSVEEVTRLVNKVKEE